MDDKDLIESLLCCLDRTDCRNCPILGQCNGTFDSALHVTIKHIKALTARLAESERQRAAAVNEICAQCKPSQIVDGVAFYDCNGCKWRGPQEAGEGGVLTIKSFVR